MVASVLPEHPKRNKEPALQKRRAIATLIAIFVAAFLVLPPQSREVTPMHLSKHHDNPTTPIFQTRRRLHEKSEFSTSEILLDLLAPGHVPKGHVVGAHTIHKAHAAGAAGHGLEAPNIDPAPAAPQITSISGLSSNGSSNSTASSSGIVSSPTLINGVDKAHTIPHAGGGPGADFGSSLEATTVFSQALELAWASRSRYRPKAGAHYRPYKSDPGTAHPTSRLPSPPRGIVEAIKAARTHSPPNFEPLGAAARGQHALNGSRPLLALIHPSTIEWPARLDVLNAALVALENAPAGSGTFDLVVVLDSQGEPKSKHDCNAKAVSMLRPEGDPGPGLGGKNNPLWCDSKQLLAGAGVPFVIANGGKGPPGGFPRAVGSAKAAALRAASLAREAASPDGVKAQQLHLRTMWATAAYYARDYGYAHLILAASPTLLSSGAVTMLARAAASWEEATSSSSSLKQSALQRSLRRAVIVPVLEGDNQNDASGFKPGDGQGKQHENYGIGLAAHHPNLLESTEQLQQEQSSHGRGLLAFAQHPLSYERTATALRTAARGIGGGGGQDAWFGFGLSSLKVLRHTVEECPPSSPAAGGGTTAPSNHASQARAEAGLKAAGLVAGVSVDTALALIAQASSAQSSTPPQLPLDDCAALKAIGVDLLAHSVAYAVSFSPRGGGSSSTMGGATSAASGSSANGLLRNDPTPYAAALSIHKSPNGGDEDAGADAVSKQQPPSLQFNQAPFLDGEKEPLDLTGKAAKAAEGSTGGSSRGRSHGLSRSRTLIVATCAGVWPRTLSLLVSLESNTRDDFDFLLAVTPRGDDASDAFARTAGIATFVQPEAVGLTNLWNLVVRYALANNYEHLFIINNDVLVADGSVTALVSALDNGAELVVPGTRFGAGILTTPLYGLSGKSEGSGATEAGMAADDAVNNPLNFARIGAALLGRYQDSPSLQGGGSESSALLRPLEGYSATYGLRFKDGKYGTINTGTFMAFFFGMKTDFIRAHLLNDKSNRLWNDTRWKNYNQEKSLEERIHLRPVGVQNAFVYHYRGSTLEPGPCKNGWLDCATWQTNHRPDMNSPWWKEKNAGLA